MEPCGHSLHKDHYQYFAYANMVASFKYVVFYVELILNVLFFTRVVILPILSVFRNLSTYFNFKYKF